MTPHSPDTAHEEHIISQRTVAEQYRTSSNLEARIRLHERFGTNRYRWHRWVFDQFDLPRPARVLELGCGIGKLWLENSDRLPQDWDVTLSDFSEGMLHKTRENLAGSGHDFAFRVIDARRIPFEPEQFDAVIANHMLYYVDDKPRAFSEMRRVLKRGGRLYAATNGGKHMQELVNLIEAFDASIPFIERTIEGFTLENGAQQVAEWFGDVEVRRYPDMLVVTDENALLDYILSASSVFDLPGPRKAELAKFVMEQFALRSGVFTIAKDAGIIGGKRI